MLNPGDISLWDKIQQFRAQLLAVGTTADDADAYIHAWLPRHYPNGRGFPRLDYGYIRDVQKAVQAGVFLDSGSLHNADLDRQRLQNTPWERRET